MYRRVRNRDAYVSDIRTTVHSHRNIFLATNWFIRLATCSTPCSADTKAHTRRTIFPVCGHTRGLCASAREQREWYQCQARRHMHSPMAQSALHTAATRRDTSTATAAILPAGSRPMRVRMTCSITADSMRHWRSSSTLHARGSGCEKLPLPRGRQRRA